MRKLIAIVIFIHAVAAGAEPGSCAALYVRGDQLWVADGGEARFLLSDSLGIEKPRWSPDGLRIAYVHRMQGRRDHVTDVMVVDTRNLSTQAVANLTWEDSVKGVLQVGWHGDEGVWIEGHVNPSTNIYYEWNVTSAERVRDLPGARFSWSPDGKQLAYTEHRAHFSPDARRAAGIMIGEQRVWVPAEGERIASPLAWSSNSASIAFVTTTEEAARLHILDPKRKVERDAIELKSGAVTRLRWTEKGKVAVEGAATDLVDVASGRVTRQPSSTRNVMRVGEESVAIADSRCGATP